MGEARANAAEGKSPLWDLAAGRFDALLGRGVVRLWEDDLLGARRDLCAVLTAGGLQMRQRAAALAHSADTHYRLGQWDAALADVERMTTAEAGEPGPLHALGQRIAVCVHAARGQWDEASARAGAARRAVHPTAPLSIHQAALAAGHLAHCRQDDAAVVAAVGPLYRREAWLVAEPGVLGWPGFHVDALLALGRRDEAVAALAVIAAEAAAAGRRSALGNAARGQALVEAVDGHHQLAANAFGLAVELLAGVPNPFDLSRALLEWGAFLRRRGQRREAARRLEQAGAGFSAVGAPVFEERVARELAACGLWPAKRHNRDRRRLTPQEATVARLAAAGRTNREIAAVLFVSPKTVEYHLGNVYGSSA